ncbi:MAG: hypothetical protein PHD81_00300 [Candidatus Nanoarchaeia archaeon]|nr:hypothetical protein [Candidatus Nanoarchaeia archaeon]MDD5587532.1 hypothetical protein [Candidatus Nanoarchaeia archaeon]
MNKLLSPDLEKLLHESFQNSIQGDNILAIYEFLERQGFTPLLPLGISSDSDWVLHRFVDLNKKQYTLSDVYNWEDKEIKTLEDETTIRVSRHVKYPNLLEDVHFLLYKSDDGEGFPPALAFESKSFKFFGKTPSKDKYNAVIINPLYGDNDYGVYVSLVMLKTFDNEEVIKEKKAS